MHVPFENLFQLVVALLLRRQDKLPSVHAEHVHSGLQDACFHAALEGVPGAEDAVVVVEAFALGLGSGRSLAELEDLKAYRTLKKPRAKIARRRRLHLRKIVHTMPTIERDYLLVRTKPTLDFAALEAQV